MKNHAALKRHKHERRLEELAGNFVPSFRITRKVSLADSDIAEAQDEIAKEMRKRFPNTPQRYKVKPAKALHLTLVEQRDLIEHFRATGVSPKSHDIKQVAHAIRDGLAEQIAADSGPLELPLGQLAVFGNHSTCIGVSVGPKSWRSVESRYACRDEGRRTPFGILFEESELCQSVLDKQFSRRYPRFSAQQLRRPTHITLLRKSNSPFHRAEARHLMGIMREIMPASVTLEDPVIRLRAGRGQNQVETIPVIDQGERFLQLAGATAMLPMLEAA